jgi:predicted HicB family RNase H-like nuclease
VPRETKGTERRSGRRGLTTAPAVLVARYTYRVAWSEEDQEFVGLCAEFPSLSWLDRSQADALAGIVRLVRGVVTDMGRAKEPIPVPMALQQYRGEFRVRIPPHLHRRLAAEAAEAKVSLNRLVSAKLAQS